MAQKWDPEWENWANNVAKKSQSQSTLTPSPIKWRNHNTYTHPETQTLNNKLSLRQRARHSQCGKFIDVETNLQTNLSCTLSWCGGGGRYDLCYDVVSFQSPMPFVRCHSAKWEATFRNKLNVNVHTFKCVVFKWPSTGRARAPAHSQTHAAIQQSKQRKHNNASENKWTRLFKWSKNSSNVQQHLGCTQCTAHIRPWYMLTYNTGARCLSNCYRSTYISKSSYSKQIYRLHRHTHTRWLVALEDINILCAGDGMGTKCASSCKWIINTCVCINMSCWRSGTWALNDRNNFFFAVLCLIVQFKPGLLKYSRIYIAKAATTMTAVAAAVAINGGNSVKTSYFCLLPASFFAPTIFVVAAVFLVHFFSSMRCARKKKPLRFIRITFIWTI